MIDIRFTVPGLPIAQPRQRTRVMTFGGKTMGQNYTPAKHPVNTFKAAVQMAARQAWSGAPDAGPLILRLTFVFPRPQAMTWKKRPMPREWCLKKPDADNLFKSFADSLNGILWVDDSQIVQTTVEKLYANGGEQAHTRAELVSAMPIAEMTGGVRSEYA